MPVGGTSVECAEPSTSWPFGSQIRQVQWNDPGVDLNDVNLAEVVDSRTPTSARSDSTSRRSGPTSRHNCTITIAMPAIVISSSAEQRDSQAKAGHAGDWCRATVIERQRTLDSNGGSGSYKAGRWHARNTAAVSASYLTGSSQIINPADGSSMSPLPLAFFETRSRASTTLPFGSLTSVL